MKKTKFKKKCHSYLFDVLDFIYQIINLSQDIFLSFAAHFYLFLLGFLTIWQSFVKKNSLVSVWHSRFHLLAAILFVRGQKTFVQSHWPETSSLTQILRKCRRRRQGVFALKQNVYFGFIKFNVAWNNR